MKLLYANDKAGSYPDSWYSATANTDSSARERTNHSVSENENYPPIAGSHAFDVCVIGGGFTGLSAALALADAGKSVCVLEAHRVGWGWVQASIDTKP